MSKILNYFVTDLKNNFQEILLFIMSLLLLFGVLKHEWQNRHFFKKLSKIQGPLTFPIIGSAYIFFRNPADFMKTIFKLHSKFPRIFKFCIGPSRVVCLLSDPEYIEKLFSTPLAIEKDNIYDVITDIIGPGLLTAPAKIWKPHRKAINPTFNKNAVDSYIPIFAEASVEFVKQLREFGNNKDFDWCTFAKRYSLDVSCKSVMGVDLNIKYSQPKGDDLGHCIDMLNHYGTIRALQLWYNVGIVYKFSSLKKKFDRYKELFNKIITSAIREKLQQLRENNNAVYAETEENKRRPALLEIIYNNPLFNEKSLTHHVNAILAGATETTGMVICTMFIMLAMHPDVEQRVYDEVIDEIGLTGQIEASGLAKLKYTERVIKETLRLFPPVVLFGRTLTGDVDLGDVILPKGVMAGIIPTLIHRDPNYWKDPLRFDPDRFLPEEAIKRHPRTFIPFSSGARNCIGWQYAYQNVKTVTAAVIREFKMFTSYKSVDEMEYTLQALLTLTHGVKLWVNSRT